jgi:hypothetical protein
MSRPPLSSSEPFSVLLERLANGEVIASDALVQQCSISFADAQEPQDVDAWAERLAEDLAAFND